MQTDSSEMSPYPGGNQCWDSDTARTVWNSVRSTDNHRRRRHGYNFDAFPRRKWPLPIEYVFNETVPSTNDGTPLREIIMITITMMIVITTTISTTSN